MKIHLIKVTKELFLLAALIFFTLSFLYLFGLLSQAKAENISNYIIPIGDNSVFENKAVNDQKVAENNFEDKALFDAAPLPAGNFNSTSNSVSVSSDEIGKPARFMIPRLNINAEVKSIGLTKDGAIGAPEGAYEVSWFNEGTRPGQKGNAIVSGHSGRWKNGSNSIFDLLYTLQSGEKINVKDEHGKVISFTVKGKRVYGKDENVPELFYKSDNAYLNIITCYGDWIEKEKTYSKRLIVFAQKTE